MMEEEGEAKFVFESYPQRVVIAVLFMVVFVLGVFGNSLTILAVAVSRKLQSVTNVFVINLAVADLLTCLTIPWNITTMLRRTEPESPYGHWSCAAAGGTLFVCIGASFYTLASIALNRYILIMRTSLFRKIYKPVVIVTWIAAIWIIAFCITIVPAIAGVGALGYNPKYKTCSDISSEYLPDKNSTQSYDIIQAVGVFPIPMVVILFSYISIIVYVRKNAKNMSNWRKEEGKSQYGETTVTDLGSSSETTNRPKISMSTIGKNSSPTADTLRTKRRSKISRQDVRVTKNLFIVFCVFMLCMLPYAFSLLYDDSDPFVPYAAAILFFNSCLNPIIYATRFPNFKKVFKVILKCKWDKIPEPSGCLMKMPCSR